MEKTLEIEPQMAELARELSRYKNFLFLARGIHYPIALIDENMPVVVLAPRDGTYDRMMSSLEEVRARDGRVFSFGHEGDRELAAKSEVMVAVPAAADLLSPLLMAIPMQLLAYHAAVRLGRDVDQPRNLAKSVTVE